MRLRQTISTWLTNSLRRRRSDHSTGARGESVAAKYLEGQRYRVLGRNLRNRLGEIDILAQAPDGHTIVVVEVKARLVKRLPGDDLLPELHVDRKKQHKLTVLGASLARQRKWSDRPIRFDVIGVDLPPERSDVKPVIRHHEGAFESHV